MPVWEAMRRNHAGESIVVLPSVTPDETQDSATLQALEERFLFLLFLLRQPRAAGDLRHRPAGAREHRRLLPRPPAGRDPAATRAAGSTWWPRTTARRARSPRSCSTPAGGRADPRADPRPAALCHLVPYTTSSLERDLALAARHPACTAPIRDLLPFGTKTGCRRLVRRGRRLHPLGGEDLRAMSTASSTRSSRCARSAPRCGRRSSSSTTASRARATPRSTSPSCPAPGSADEPAPAPRAARGDGVRAARHHPRGLPRPARERRRHRRGADRGRRAAQPERAAARDAARRGRAAVDARPAPRWPERPELPRLPVPCRLRVRAGDQPRGGEDRAAARARGRPRPLRGRLRRRPRRERRVDAVRDRDQPAQGRHDAPVPHAPVPDRRPLRPGDGAVHGAERTREAPRRDRPPRVRSTPRAHPRRPVRRRGPAPASTSTRRGRPASCST